MKRIQRRAEAEATTGDASLRRWWANKYGVPTNDVRFRRRSLGSLMQEMFEDLYARRAALTELLEHASAERGVAIREELFQLKQVLEPRPADLPDSAIVTGDPLFDEWEAAIARGEAPDLAKGLKPRRFTVVPHPGKDR